MRIESKSNRSFTSGIAIMTPIRCSTNLKSRRLVDLSDDFITPKQASPIRTVEGFVSPSEKIDRLRRIHKKILNNEAAPPPNPTTPFSVFGNVSW
jgi:hypothetical protein